jgi:hypothetical protein
MLAEEFRTFASFGVRLNAAQLGVLRRHHDCLDSALAEELENVFACFCHELVGEEIAIADDDA